MLPQGAAVVSTGRAIGNKIAFMRAVSTPAILSSGYLFGSFGSRRAECHTVRTSTRRFVSITR